MNEWFLKSGYLESAIEKEIKNLRFSKQGQNSKKVEKGVSFVVTCHPLLNKLSSIIHRNLHVLYVNQEVENVFTTGFILSYRSAREVSSCPVVRAYIFTSTTKIKCFKINHKLNRDNNCLI